MTPVPGAERCRLYLITPPKITLDQFLPAYCSALVAGDIAAVQLRLKGASDEEILAIASEIGPLARQSGAAFLINDRIDLAKAAAADGVHLGQRDGTVHAARQHLGADSIIGVTCHDSIHLAMLGAEQGADYIAFGTFFPSSTKSDPKGCATPDLLQRWSIATTVPCVAIGGITPQNCTPLIEAGADFLAVSSAIWDHPSGVAAAVQEFEQMISQATDNLSLKPQ